MSVPVWAWAALTAFILAMLAADLLVAHRRAHEVGMREAAAWSAVWVAAGLGFAGLLWAWRGGGVAQAYLAGYLIEKSLSLDNIFLFGVIFSAFAIPARYQHRVLMLGVLGALVLRAGFVLAGAAVLHAFDPARYLFGAVLLYAAARMLRAGQPDPRRSRVLRAVRRALPVTSGLHGQRFLVRRGGTLLATPLLLALVVIETTDVLFAVDSIPAVLAVTTDTFVVFAATAFAAAGMRALYFLLVSAAGRFRYLTPALAVILAGVAAKLLLAGVAEFPVWVSPAFIVAVLATAAGLSLRGGTARPQRPPRDLHAAGPAVSTPGGEAEPSGRRPVGRPDGKDRNHGDGQPRHGGPRGLRVEYGGPVR